MSILIGCLLIVSSCKKDIRTESLQPTLPRAVIPMGSVVTLQGNNGKFLSSENGTQAVTCSRSPASTWEQFQIVDAGSGKVALKSMSKFVSSENGTQAVTCNRTDYQAWEIFTMISNSNGTVTFQGSNGKYLSSENGTQAVTCTRSPASTWEQFTFSIVSAAVIPMGSFVTLQGNNGKFLSSENGTQAVTCSRSPASTWEQFQIVDAGSGKVALKSMNKFVSSENGTQAVTCNRTGFQAWEIFTIIYNSNGTLTFQGYNGKFLSSENGTQAVTCTRSPASTWEQFTYSIVSSFATLRYLNNISGTKTIAGQQGMQYWQPMKDITGRYPGIWGEDFSFQPFQNTTSMSEWRNLVTSTAKQRWAEGALISLMFHSCPPTQAEPCDWETGIKSHLSDSQWNELITDGTTLNNNWKARLNTIAVYLQDLKNNGVEVMFRPFHEMNQGVFWWAGRPGANGTARLYQITHDYLVNTKGLTNLIWVWNLQDFSTLSSDLTAYDPGSNYWDILSLDVYWSDGTGFTTAKYNLMLNKAGSKPIAIGECGTLPSSSLLASQPRWTSFLGWSELTQQQNSNADISAVYNAGNVVTLDRLFR